MPRKFLVRGTFAPVGTRRDVTAIGCAGIVAAVPAAAQDGGDPVTLFTSAVAGAHAADATPAGICHVTVAADGGHGGGTTRRTPAAEMLRSPPGSR